MICFDNITAAWAVDRKFVYIGGWVGGGRGSPLGGSPQMVSGPFGDLASAKVL